MRRSSKGPNQEKLYINEEWSLVETSMHLAYTHPFHTISFFKNFKITYNTALTYSVWRWVRCEKHLPKKEGGGLGVKFGSQLLGKGKQLHTMAIACQVSLSMHIDRLGQLCNHCEWGWWRYSLYNCVRFSRVGQRKKQNHGRCQICVHGLV